MQMFKGIELQKLQVLSTYSSFCLCTSSYLRGFLVEDKRQNESKCHDYVRRTHTCSGYDNTVVVITGFCFLWALQEGNNYGRNNYYYVKQNFIFFLHSFVPLAYFKSIQSSGLLTAIQIARIIQILCE